MSSSEISINVPTQAASPGFQSRCEMLAGQQGLRFLGVAPTSVEKEHERFVEWLRSGWHAEMFFLERNSNLLKDPNSLLPGVKAALVFALPYSQGDKFFDESPYPQVAQYARFRDYHRIFKKSLTDIVEQLGLKEGEYRVAVDSAPLLERAIANQTARGFIGKNTCFIHPTFGSFLLLGEILVTCDFPHDDKVAVDPTKHLPEGGCGICNRCQVKCPTGALDDAYRLDARKCLSYWTIEHRGVVPLEYWRWFKEYWFGCDICQLVCPYNKKEENTNLSSRFLVREIPSLLDVVKMDQAGYEKWFGGTPMTRAGRQGLRRNALIAMVATGDAKLNEAIDAVKLSGGSPLEETLAQIPSFLRGFQADP